MPSIDYASLRSPELLRDLLRSLGWEPTSIEPTSLRGWCPLHSSGAHASRAFSLDRKGRWRCHRCRLQGDVIDLWTYLYPEHERNPVRSLCRHLGISVPYLPRTPRRRRMRDREEDRKGG